MVVKGSPKDLRLIEALGTLFGWYLQGIDSLQVFLGDAKRISSIRTGTFLGLTPNRVWGPIFGTFYHGVPGGPRCLGLQLSKLQPACKSQVELTFPVLPGTIIVLGGSQPVD